MAAPGCRRLSLTCVAFTLTADCTAVTAMCIGGKQRKKTSSDLYGSQLAAILAPCLVAFAIAVMLAVTMVAIKVWERWRMEGSFSPRQLEESVLGVTSLSTLTARVERLLECFLRAEGLTSDLLLGVSLVSVAVLLVLVFTTAGLVVTPKSPGNSWHLQPEPTTKGGITSGDVEHHTAATHGETHLNQCKSFSFLAKLFHFNKVLFATT